jgi:hypothetical protein
MSRNIIFVSIKSCHGSAVWKWHWYQMCQRLVCLHHQRLMHWVSQLHNVFITREHALGCSSVDCWGHSAQRIMTFCPSMGHWGIAGGVRWSSITIQQCFPTPLYLSTIHFSFSFSTSYPPPQTSCIIWHSLPTFNTYEKWSVSRSSRSTPLWQTIKIGQWISNYIWMW